MLRKITFRGMIRNIFIAQVVIACFSILPAIGQTTKTVGGVGANYSTLKTAFDAINAGRLTGVIHLQLTGSPVETASAVIYQSGRLTGEEGRSNYTSVVIYPVVPGVVISGNLNAAVIDFNGAANVTLDGRVNGTGAGKSLSISNSSTGASATTIRFLNSAVSDMIKYCFISGSVPSAAQGIITFYGSNAGSGNDNNTIEHCSITSTGSNRPLNAILSSGTIGRENSGNMILNNTIYNFFNAGNYSYGVNIVSNSIGWTISGNSFYETTEFKPAGAYSYNVIRVAASTEQTISGNYIGGNAPLCEGSAWLVNAHTAVYYCGIFVYGGTGTAVSILNNTISNIQFTSTEDNPWDGIFIYSGNAEVTGNTIGATTGNGSILCTTPIAVATSTLSGGGVGSVTVLHGGSGYTSAPTVSFTVPSGATAPTATAYLTDGVVTAIVVNTSGSGYSTAPSVVFDGQSNNYSTSHGMINNSTGVVNITGNTIGSITTAGSAYYSHGFESIYVRGVMATTTISNNLIGSQTTANSIHVSAAAGSSLLKEDVYGIYAASLGTTIISGNTVANLTNAYAGTNSLSRTRGIQTVAGTNTIQNNTVRNIMTSSAQSSAKIAASAIGISQASTTAGLTQVTSGNSVYNVSNTNGTASVFVYGIYNSGSSSGTAVVSNNLVHSLSLASSNITSEMDGILLNGGMSTCSNNIVNLGVGIAGGYKIYGIFDEGGSGNSNNSYFNSVYLGGTPLATTSSTAAFWSNNNTSARNYRNNILVNARSGGTTGKHYAIRINGTAGLTIDYNDYYSSGSNGVLGDFGADRSTIAAWRTATGQDAHSLNINPGFTAPGGTTAFSYYTAALLPGVTGTGISTDYSGITRSATPKMGALEANNFVWKGTFSTNFGNAANWLGGIVPPDGSDISFDPDPANSCELDQDRSLKNIANTQSDDELVTNGHRLIITGNLDFTGGARIDATSASSVVVVAGESLQNVPSSYFVNSTVNAFTLSNSNGLMLAGDFTVSQALTLASGILTIGANTLTLDGEINATSGSLSGGSSSNMVFGGSGTGTGLPSITLNNLTINRPDGISLTGSVTVEGILALSAGTLNLGTNSLTISGNSPTCAGGNLAAGNPSSNLIFNNPAVITLPASFFFGPVNNLTINGGGGIIAGSDITVNGMLRLNASNPLATRGLLEMTVDYANYPGTSNAVYLNSHVLYMGSEATTEGPGDVTGTVKRTTILANTPYTFGHQYTTMMLTTGIMPDALAVTITVGKTPPGIFPEDHIQDAYRRTYEIVPTVAEGYSSTSRLAANFHYLDDELTSSISPYHVNTEATTVTWDYDIGGGIPADEHGRSTYDFTDNYIGLSNVPIDYFINIAGHNWRTVFTLRDYFESHKTWNGSESSSWDDESNWTPAGLPGIASHVIIPDAGATPNDPVLREGITINTLTLENGAVLNMDDKTLTIKTSLSGGWEDQNPVGNDPGTSTVVFLNPGTTISGNARFFNVEIADGADITNQVNSFVKIGNSLMKTGTGKWYADVYDNCVEYDKSGDQDIAMPDGTTAYRNLVLRGSGIKNMPATALELHGDFTVAGDASATAAGNLTITGNLITDPGATFITGEFNHTIGGDISSDGTITCSANSTVACKGHFSNNGIFSGIGGTLIFNGTMAQTVGGAVPATFGNVTINNTEEVYLDQDEVLDGTLTLANGKITLGSRNLLLGTESSISGYSAVNYIVTDGIGVLQRWVPNAGTEVIYPIGLASEYLPVNIRLTAGSVSDMISARVMAGLFTSYDVNDFPDGMLITEKGVDKTWILNEETAGGSHATVTLQWNIADEETSFDRTMCHLAHFSAGAWVHAPCTSAAGSNPYAQTFSDVASFAPFGVFSQNITCAVGLSEFCAGSSFPVEYSLTGGTLIAGNIFTVQLSDVSGGFTSPVDIGTVTSTIAGTVQALFPAGTANGYGYRVRVVSSSPAIIGDDNGSDLTVNQPSYAGTAPTVADLQAAGTNVKWYALAEGGSPLAGAVELEYGSHYYASQTVNGCESATRFEVTAAVDPTPCAPGGTPSQSFGSGATVADLAATGQNIRWYTAAIGGVALPAATVLVSGNYYASQTIDCTQSATRFQVAVTVP